MYGKLIDGMLKEAPKKLVLGGNQVWNASEEDYRAQGWKPVRFTECPEAPDGYYYDIGWSDEEMEIVRTWTLKPIPDTPTADDVLDILLGEEE